MSAPPQARPLRVFSCGAGVQSTAIALLMRAGRLPRADHVIFADTGWEPAGTYAQLDRLARVFAELGIPLHHVAQGNLRADAIDPGHRFASVPYFVRNPDGSDGMGRRQCTAEYKLAPINRRVRELLGAVPPTFRRVPAGRVAEQWIGFSTDEIGRVSDRRRVRYLVPRYPLLELGFSRRDCVRLLERAGWGDTAKSACIGCPFHSNRQWRQLRDEHPGEWADAVAFDAAIRRGGARGLPLHGEAFLHRSRVPLDQAPIDRWTRGDIAAATAAAQTDLLDLITDPHDEAGHDDAGHDDAGHDDAGHGDAGRDEGEDGDRDGCSPYGCRSGTPEGLR